MTLLLLFVLTCMSRRPSGVGWSDARTLTDGVSWTREVLACAARNIMPSGTSKRSRGISEAPRIGSPLMVNRVRVPERSGRRGRRKRSTWAALRVKTPAARV